MDVRNSYYYLIWFQHGENCVTCDGLHSFTDHDHSFFTNNKLNGPVIDLGVYFDPYG